MKRDYVRWWSPALGREMELLVFGHGGTPIVAFPSSMGRFHEWEDFGMVGALAPQLEHGHNVLVCVDSVDRESLYNRSVSPGIRLARHRQYQAYVADEVLPFARHRGGHDFVIGAGASFGAYHAADLHFKRPGLFGKLIALSGAYDIRAFLDGHYGDDAYFATPVDYLPNLHDPGALGALRRTAIVLTVGEHDPCRAANERLHAILRDKGVPHTYHFLHGAFGHDWPWWRDLVAHYVR